MRNDEPPALVWPDTVQVAGVTVELDLVADGDVEPERAMGMLPFVREPAKFDQLARAAMVADLGNETGAGLYVSHHLAEVPAGTVSTWFPGEASVSPEAFLARLRLLRIGLDPEHGTAVLDYSIDPEVTQYLLVVSFDQQGEVTGVAMES